MDVSAICKCERSPTATSLCFSKKLYYSEILLCDQRAMLNMFSLEGKATPRVDSRVYWRENTNTLTSLSLFRQLFHIAITLDVGKNPILLEVFALNTLFAELKFYNL